MNYSLSNFKIFSGSEPHTFELAPITMLIGENNSGKSTITKSLLLFQNFFASIRNDFINGYFRGWNNYLLDFTIGDHKLGSYENVMPFNSKNGDFTVGFSIESGVLAYTMRKSPKYDVVINFAKSIKDSNSQLCLQAYIKGISIKIDGEDFYSYTDNKESIDITSIRKQYLAILKTINNQATGRQRPAPNSFYTWLRQSQRSSFEKYRQLLDRFLMGGRIVLANLKENKGESLPNSVFPTDILSEVQEFGINDFKSFIDDKTNQVIEKYYNDEASKANLLQHIGWLKTDFENSKYSTFNAYYQDLEKTYTAHIKNLIVEQHTEDSLLYKAWSEVVAMPFDDVQRKWDSESKFEYILSLLSFPGIDDYAKHYYLQCLKNFVLLLLGEVFLLNDKLVDFVHLGLDRAGMQRLYTFKSQGNGFNRILANYMQQAQEVQLDRTIAYHKGQFLQNWLKKMTKYESIDFQYAAEGEGVYIYLKEKDNKQTLADVGYGMTPLVAIMIQIELAILQMGIENHRSVLPQGQNSKTTIIIEEPESNLHPNYQAKLADMFVDAYKEYGIEFILETHSEYLARRMQVIVKEKGVERDNIIIHNLKDGQDREIRIKEDGNLSQRFWPGFYSESTSLISDLL